MASRDAYSGYLHSRWYQIVVALNGLPPFCVVAETRVQNVSASTNGDVRTPNVTEQLHKYRPGLTGNRWFMRSIALCYVGVSSHRRTNVRELNAFGMLNTETRDSCRKQQMGTSAFADYGNVYENRNHNYNQL
ncbi:hypothetical protein BD410DRAFT_790419 [Rickenella mellea]|uniref:Uncharacterized protein n=1 Tax=Rickenella mellea TaxID=50990 RepID=A0A4Y7PZE1_9AGAM|nr:hypothetical protein BD410DRAFT_790419 [Rickenella mellea]